MMRRLLFIVIAGALMAALAATAAVAQQDTATLSFEVVTEGEVPENTIFRAAGGPPDGALSAIGLTDPDGAGTYTGSVELQTGEYRVLIEQGTSGEPGRTTIYGPETITLDEDTTISTSVDFGSEFVTPDQGVVTSDQAAPTGGTSVLPATGGPALLLPTAALFLATGLLVMGLVRRRS